MRLIFTCLFVFFPLLFFAQQNSKPNVVIIYADDMGYGDVGIYGQFYGTPSTASTPNMDGLAAEGKMFTNAHSASAVCTPSRYALLTGNYNWRELPTGVSGSYGEPEIPSSDVTIAEYLKTQGYQTAAFGKWHLGGTFFKRDGGKYTGRNNTITNPANVDWERPLEGHALDNGFDVFKGLPCAIGRPPYVYLDGDRLQYFDTSTNQYRNASNIDTYHPFTADELDDGLTEGTSHREGLGDPSYIQREAGPKMISEAEQYIADRVGDSDPFFMYVALYSPHTPWQVTAPFAGSEGFQYGDFMREVDDRMGRIINAIDNNGFKNNTIIILSSDNGPEKAAFVSSVANGRDGNGPFKGIKRDSWEGGTRVPFIVRWPGIVQPGTTSDALTWQGDIFRTLAEIYGDCLPEDVAPDAVSILPVLSGNATSVSRNAVVTSSNNNQLSVRTNDGWKLIDGTGGGGKDTSFDGNNQEISNAKGTIGGSPKQLYYLPSDIVENNNRESSDSGKASEMLNLLNEIRQGLPENQEGGGGTISLIPTDAVTVAAATPADPKLSGSFVLRERTTGDNNPNRHISGFLKFDIASLSSFDTSNGDKAFVEVKLLDRLNSSKAADLKVARITGGDWTTSNLPQYTWATASLAPIGPGSQADELTLINGVHSVGLNSTYSVEVTSIVDSWVNGNTADYGFGLYLTEAYQGVSLSDFQLNIQQECGGNDGGGGACQQTVINTNDFESGLGIWNDGGADCKTGNDPDYASSGTVSIRLRDNTSTSVMTTDNLNLTTYQELTVDFHYITRSFESGEDFWLQISTDGGSSYTTVQSWSQGNDFNNNTGYNESVIISGPFSSNTRLRFRCDASDDSDKVHLDDIQISGCADPNARVGDEMFSHSNGLFVYPNPVRERITLAYSLDADANVTTAISDISGRMVYQNTANKSAGEQTDEISVNQLPAGLYIVIVRAGDLNFLKKIIIE